jgi:hypothetical protein
MRQPKLLFLTWSSRPRIFRLGESKKLADAPLGVAAELIRRVRVERTEQLLIPALPQ